MRNYTNAALLVREDYRLRRRPLHRLRRARSAKYDKTTWTYQLDEDGYAKVDPTLQDPHCVFQRLKKHFSRYTPEMVERITGTPKDKFLKVCELIASTSAPDRTMTSLYALGWTQHTVGSQNIRSIAIIQLLLGNMGMPGGGVNALRGHSNIQGLTDLGLLSHLLPGYLTLPTDGEPDLKTYLDKRTPKPLRPGQINYWQNYPKFFVSLLKAWYGAAATKENDFGYELLPKIDGGYDVLRVIRADVPGQGERLLLPGLQPAVVVPGQGQGHRRPAQAQVPRHHRSAGHRDLRVLAEPRRVQRRRSVPESRPRSSGCRPPASPRRTARSSIQRRWLQWHWKGAEPPGEAKGDLEIMGELFLALRKLYAKDGGAFPDPILKLTWPYRIAEIARRRTSWPGSSTAQALADVPDPKDPGKILVRQGEQVPGFAVLQADGTTACGCWIFSGSWTQAGNQMARRDAADPERTRRHSRVGLVVAGQPAHPLQPRLLRRRGRSLGSPPASWCGGTGRSGSATTCPTSRPTHRPPTA